MRAVGHLNRKARRTAEAMGRTLERAGGWSLFVAGPMPDVRVYTKLGNVTATFKNNLFAVIVAELDTDWGHVHHLMIRKHAGDVVPGWSALQRIKNELFGAERTAVEVYPAESELVDNAPMRHLWVLPDGFVLPFTLKDVG